MKKKREGEKGIWRKKKNKGVFGLRGREYGLVHDDTYDELAGKANSMPFSQNDYPIICLLFVFPIFLFFILDL